MADFQLHTTRNPCWAVAINRKLCPGITDLLRLKLSSHEFWQNQGNSYQKSHSSRDKACLLHKASPKTEHDLWLSCEHSSVADTSSTRRTIYSQPSDASGGVLTSLIINLPGTAGLGWLTLGKNEGDAHTLTQSVEAIALSHWTITPAMSQSGTWNKRETDE